ncbi:hypothetical protein Alo02nite_92990 [Actinoplanes lobatus]|nr:hypothetical protein Alo02nite_92990 [Actinoplanes lobatus]
MTAVEAIGVDVNATVEILALHMPERILKGLARIEAQELVDRWVKEGRFVRLTEGRIVATPDYDPQVHGPVVQS